MAVHDAELADLRARVDCRTVLEQAQWALDRQGSTAHSPKYRQGDGGIVIVTHDGKGWYDPLNGKKGDVIALAQHVWGGNLGHARKALRPLAGIAPSLNPAAQSAAIEPVNLDQWHLAPSPRPGSRTWAYLTEARGLPASTVERAAQAGVLREGIYGTVLAKHVSADGQLVGWEMRGPCYKGYSKGGAKALFSVGDAQATRIVVTEAVIDTLSLASIETWPRGTLYVSTGGGYGPQAEKALQAMLRPGVMLVAATDQGQGGELLARRLQALARHCHAGYERLAPLAKDWNEQINHLATTKLASEVKRAAVVEVDRRTGWTGHRLPAFSNQEARRKR